ncbi:MAG: response regulator [Hyphomicrobiales bacterium]|nr:response regulator [Hyphomicrobiales bacterium]
MPYTVLYVSNGDDLQENIIQLLVEEDIDVIPVEEKNEAFAVLQEESCQLLLVDIDAPAGTALLRHLLKEAHFHLPVMILTSGKYLTLEDEALDHGLCSILYKPWDERTLVSRVRQCIHSAPLRLVS